MSYAIRIARHGGPEVLVAEDFAPQPPAAGEALVRHHAVGLNYIDVYHRTGTYPGTLPHGIGMEGAGTVESVGPGVTLVAPGDRVAYAAGPPGSYAVRRTIAADRLLKLPDTIGFDTAAAMMLKGMTAQYLLHGCYRVQAGDTILVHAAAGGVGLILCQWAKALGATVIGTVGDAGKAALASRYGCDHPINYRTEDFAARVNAITGGAGVAAVYESVGRDTFDKSLECLRPLGTIALYGQSSGAPAPLDLGRLAPKSLFVTRPSLFGYTAQRADLETIGASLFDAVAGGKVGIEINQTYPLREASRAHRDLEARKTTGCTVLLP
jgi:NADPH2:quinone reductase